MTMNLTCLLTRGIAAAIFIENQSGYQNFLQI
jgi:hypothetical protein